MSPDMYRMAREAGFPFGPRSAMPLWDKELERFAALVADAEAKRIHDEGMVTIGHMREQIAAEREACAKDRQDAARYRHMRKNAQFQSRNGPGLYWYLPRLSDGDEGQRLDDAIDAAIRARGQA